MWALPVLPKAWLACLLTSVIHSSHFASKLNDAVLWELAEFLEELRTYGSVWVLRLCSLVSIFICLQQLISQSCFVLNGALIVGMKSTPIYSGIFYAFVLQTGNKSNTRGITFYSLFTRDNHNSSCTPVYLIKKTLNWIQVLLTPSLQPAVQCST